MQAESANDSYLVDPDCPVCDRVPGPREKICCDECDRPHHIHCWILQVGCQEAGCNSKKARAQASHPPRQTAVLERRPEPRIWFVWLMAGFLFSSYATVLFAPSEVCDYLLEGLAFGFGGLGFVLLLAQLFVRVRYRFVGKKKMVEQEVLVGNVSLFKDRAWRRFDQCKAIDIQLVPRSSDPEAPPIVQVWLHHPTGASLLLRDEAFDQSSEGARRICEAVQYSNCPLRVSRLGGDKDAPDYSVSAITGYPFEMAEE